MPSGDGLILRVRPRRGRLDASQVLALCAAAATYGDGVIALTNRANLQLRGVRPEAHPALLDALASARLLDDDEAAEARRNILVAPLWREGDDAPALAAALEARIGEAPDLPAKFGFAVDTGAAPALTQASADIRIERAGDGGLIVRADGAPAGRRVAAADAVDRALELACWFRANGGADAGRMAKLLRRTQPPMAWTEAPPASSAPPLRPGASRIGPVLGAAFGEAPAEALSAIMRRSAARAIRLTPWRLFILEGGAPVTATPFLTEADDPLLRVDACPGAPRCPAATVETRRLARALAGRAAGETHVSGCAKGCARARPARLTLVGRDGAFDLVRDGDAGATPTRRGLSPDAALAAALS